MSEDRKDEETAQAVTAEPASDAAGSEAPKRDEPAADDRGTGAPRPVADRSAAPRAGTASVSWLALFLSLLTLAAVGYMIVEDRRTRAAEEASGDSIAHLAGRLDDTGTSVSDLDRKLADLAADSRSLRSDVEGLERELDDHADLLESVPGRLANLENSMSALQGASAGARDTWLLAEAEYYLQIANAQLQLGNNPRLAMLALDMADERVVQMANPALTDVRRAIADERAALEVMEKPDIEGASLTLASLARVVESLPLQTVASDGRAGGDDVNPELTGMARAWASVKNAMAGIIRVTPPDADRKALLTPDTARLVRSNLALQLQAARLALLRGEQTIFEQSLDDADALLVEYFDTDSAPVASAQQTIVEIRGSMVSVTPPDISESLRLIRQFRVLSGSSQ